MVKAVHWIWVVTSLWLTGYAHALAWDELTPFEVSASTPIIAAPSNNVSAQGVVTRYKASRCRLGYQSSIEDKDKPKVQTIEFVLVQLLTQQQLDKHALLLWNVDLALEHRVALEAEELMLKIHQ